MTGTQTANQAKPKTANLVSNLTVQNGLVSAGYDALGAKLFKQAAIVNGNLSQFAANVLKENTTYKFEIKADLQEKINNVWHAVKRKGSNMPVKQTEKIYFKTNTAAVGNPVITVGNAVR